MKQQCAGEVPKGTWGRVRPCCRPGTLEHNGQWFCAAHHPPTKKARTKERTDKWERQHEAERKATRLAKREQALAARALEWVRKNRPEMVAEWEGDL